MAKQLISKTYDAASDTWTEVYRLQRPIRQHPAPAVELVEWPVDRDVWSAKELVCHYLGVQDVTAGDLKSYIYHWRRAGVIQPLYGGKLIKVDGKPRHYYAVRNAEQYNSPTKVRNALKARGNTASNTSNTHE